jgi:hypothetical protein
VEEKNRYDLLAVVGSFNHVIYMGESTLAGELETDMWIGGTIHKNRENDTQVVY